TASADSSARPRFVCSTTPVALITRVREKAPARVSAARASRASAAASRGARLAAAAPPAEASRRWRSRASAGSPSSAVSTASTEGSPRRSACSAAAPAAPRAPTGLPTRGKARLHALLHPRDHLVRLTPQRLGAHALGPVPEEPPHRFLGEARPELVEIAGGKALAAQRPRPLAGQLRDEPIPLVREPAGALDQLGQPGRRHGRHSRTSRRSVSIRFASQRPVETQG